MLAHKLTCQSVFWHDNDKDLKRHVVLEKQRSAQRKFIEHLGNLPPHRGNVTHQGIFISQPCYEDRCKECACMPQIT